MRAKDQFPTWKIGILYALISLLTVSSPLTSISAVKNIHRTVAEDFGVLELMGPEYLCIVFGGVIGTFSGGGDPETDVYTWVVTDQNGEVIFNQSGGGVQYETVKISFNEIGKYQVKLNVRRNNQSDFYEKTMEVTVQKGPELALEPDYLLCNGGYAELTAINPNNTPNINDYTIIWRDVLDNEIASGNTIQAYYEGYYKVEIFLTNSEGGQDCLITGSTFVGPPIDFKIIQSSEQICEGENITFSLDTPLSGEWFIRKDTETTKVSLGEGFEKVIRPEDIDGIGYFEVYFSAVNEEFPDCRSERRKFFFVNEAPKIQLSMTDQPEDCSDPSGGFQVTTQSEIDSLFIPELGLTEFDISAGQTLSYSNLKPKIYTVKAFKNGCEVTELMKLEAMDPPLTASPPSQANVNIIEEPETCSPTGVSRGKLTFEFDEPVTGSFRVMQENEGEITYGELINETSKTVDLLGGKYVLELIMGGCTYPMEEVIIGTEMQVEYSVPESINICETFDLIPETEEDLTYTLTFPDGHEEQIGANGAFSLTEPGDYEILAVSNDASLGLCPKKRQFTASLSQSISFDYQLIEEDCFGNKVFEASIEGIEPENASIRWQNSDGEIVGRSPIFYPTAYGTYSLIVQPLGSGYCPVEKIYFEVVEPIFRVDTELEATKICPQPYEATITLTTDEEAVDHIEWIFFDLNGNRENLTALDDLLEIPAVEVGTYEVVVYSKLGCELGRNQIEVEESTFTTLPQVEDSYAFCSIENNTIPAIDPGDFATYSWFHEDQLVSTSPTYKPEEIGDYVLVVTTEDGCEFTAEFNTYDACKFQVVYPNAMILNQADKDFRVLISEGVSEAELFVLNRQGTLIHHELTSEIPVETPILQWDGTINGKNIPSGTYVVILLLRNNEFGFEDKITSSLLVIE